MPKRDLVKSGSDKRYVRRDAQGRFTSEQDDVGRASASDQRQRARTPSKPGYGDRGDRGVGDKRKS